MTTKSSRTPEVKKKVVEIKAHEAKKKAGYTPASKKAEGEAKNTKALSAAKKGTPPSNKKK